MSIGQLRVYPMAYVRGKDVWTALTDGSRTRLAIRNADMPCWAFDHTRLLFVRNGAIRLANVAGELQHTVVELPADPKTEITCISWDSVGRSVWFSRTETTFIGTSKINLREIRSSSIYVSTRLDRSPVRTEKMLDAIESDYPYRLLSNERPSVSPKGGLVAIVRNGDLWYAHRNERRLPGTSADDGLTGYGWDFYRLIDMPGTDWATDRSSLSSEAIDYSSWSPDARRLVYSTHRLEGSGLEDVYIATVHVDRGSVEAKPGRELIEQLGHPCFSPDGRCIVCEHYEDGTHIVRADLDGNLKKIVDDGRVPAL